MPFSHENLKVYQRALSFCARVGAWTGAWDGRHAIADQFSRAAGSILENIAMASAAHSAMKMRCMDYAIGSSIECAACFDLAHIKRLLDGDTVRAGKAELSQILRMLVGLRKAWGNETGSVREDGGEYRVRDEDFDKAYDKAYDKVEDGGEAMFHHETLDVYRGALAAAGVIYSSQAITDLPNPAFRRLDELITSMVLNIAEGNGRFSDADQARFLGTSYESAIKLAARLDLCCARGLLPRSETNGFKGPLERVAAMTYGMIRSVKAKGGQNA